VEIVKKGEAILGVNVGHPIVKNGILYVRSGEADQLQIYKQEAQEAYYTTWTQTITTIECLFTSMG